MRIIKLIIFISFLFNSVAYPYDTLRPNLMTDKGKEAERLRDAVDQVALKDTKPPGVDNDDTRSITQRQQKIEELKDNLKSDAWDGLNKADKCMEIAEEYKALGDDRKAKEMLEEAEGWLDPAYSNYAATDWIIDLARCYIAMFGDFNEAERLAQWAIFAADDHPPEFGTVEELEKKAIEFREEVNVLKKKGTDVSIREAAAQKSTDQTEMRAKSKDAMEGRPVEEKQKRLYSPDGGYYIMSRKIFNPSDRGTTRMSIGSIGNDFVYDDVLYNSSGKEIISGEEIFGSDKHRTSSIELKFVSSDIFIAIAEGGRENMILYVYSIKNDNPSFLYKVDGGDCTRLDQISRDGELLVNWDITGEYEGGNVGEYFKVVRYKGDEVSNFRSTPEGAEITIHLLDNGKWIETVYQVTIINKADQVIISLDEVVTGAEELQLLYELLKEGKITKGEYEQFINKAYLYIHSSPATVSVAGPITEDYAKYQAKNARLTDDGEDNDEHGVTMVSGLPMSDEVLEVMKTIGDVLSEEFSKKEGVSISLYDDSHTHATISSIIRGTKNQITDLDDINAETILDIIKQTKPFMMEFKTVTINGKGEILLLGNATKETEDDLVTFRQKLIGDAKFYGRPEDRNAGVHAMIGYIKGFDKLNREEKEYLAQKIEDKIANLPNLGTMEVKEVNLVYYLHRSLGKIVNRIPLKFGEDYPELRGKVERTLLASNFSLLKGTPVLFLDTEVVANPDGFKEALKQLKTNEGNIPVILLTEKSADNIKDELKISKVDLKDVQFRTLAELGLENFKLEGVMSLITGIEDLQSIPLTEELCKIYKELQKVRDEV